ncbi:hypothetical protein VitviT2T_024600 [Vitis vinifera]|uniref:Reverse transcriptase/retrotransposon-derived protein RNase H-like domain-containing protein n=1 Tax=Vitis vinifera TaxID=29760 RepID=A0ABY9DGH6_VITVI|nr:hypothetical protein VitviT2T_024600 [Vitis vinifera]
MFLFCSSSPGSDLGSQSGFTSLDQSRGEIDSVFREEALASLRQEISGQQSRPPVAQDETPHDSLPPPPPPPIPSAPQASPYVLHGHSEVAPPIGVQATVIDDAHARMNHIEQRMRQMKVSDGSAIWDDQCQHAFERIREYLLSPPVLAPPTPGRPLLLYLSISDVALGCMLAQLDDSGKDRAIYYLSKRMLDYETRYVTIERYCLALVWAPRRLRHYMTEYSVHLISRLDPLRYLFDRPALVGRLMKWLVLLTEFDIHYVTQKSIRGSIVADHLASLPVSYGRAINDDFSDEDVIAGTNLSGWRMYFDGAANHSGYGIGVLLISPHGDHIPRSVRLAFSDQHPATNNIVE